MDEGRNLETLPDVVHEAIDSYARYYAEHHKLGLSIRDDMRYIASMAIRWATNNGYEKDAERWRAVFGEDLTYMREPLYNARTGSEIKDEARWTIWWNGPKRADVRSAIDAAIEKEKKP